MSDDAKPDHKTELEALCATLVQRDIRLRSLVTETLTTLAEAFSDPKIESEAKALRLRNLIVASPELMMMDRASRDDLNVVFVRLKESAMCSSVEATFNEWSRRLAMKEQAEGQPVVTDISLNNADGSPVGTPVDAGDRVVVKFDEVINKFHPPVGPRPDHLVRVDSGITIVINDEPLTCIHTFTITDAAGGLTGRAVDIKGQVFEGPCHIYVDGEYVAQQCVKQKPTAMLDPSVKQFNTNILAMINTMMARHHVAEKLVKQFIAKAKFESEGEIAAAGPNVDHIKRMWGFKLEALAAILKAVDDIDDRFPDEVWAAFRELRARAAYQPEVPVEEVAAAAGKRVMEALVDKDFSVTPELRGLGSTAAEGLAALDAQILGRQHRAAGEDLGAASLAGVTIPDDAFYGNPMCVAGEVLPSADVTHLRDIPNELTSPDNLAEPTVGDSAQP